MTKYEKSRNWTMFLEDSQLFITKGADEIYLVDDVDTVTARAVFEAYDADSFAGVASDPQYQEILDKLERAGVIYRRRAEPKATVKIFIRYFGDPSADLKREIESTISRKAGFEFANGLEDCDLLLMIRISEPIKNLFDDYDSVTCPHLLVDLGYANTISIGPLVFKDETA
ncbi:MAG: hypothetical protein LBE83_03505, partial [Propionibacteriaceae bacterium]|nr:hypothetical protein [Propionibacteriaceae bacterium]